MAFVVVSVHTMRQHWHSQLGIHWVIDMAAADSVVGIVATVAAAVDWVGMFVREPTMVDLDQIQYCRLDSAQQRTHLDQAPHHPYPCPCQLEQEDRLDCHTGRDRVQHTERVSATAVLPVGIVDTWFVIGHSQDHPVHRFWMNAVD